MWCSLRPARLQVISLESVLWYLQSEIQAKPHQRRLGFCADRDELDKYLADPLVRKDISAGLFWELLGSMKRTGSIDAYEAWNKDMPILLLYGEDDRLAILVRVCRAFTVK